MGSKPVRVSEENYETVRKVAALHGKSLSDTVDMLVEVGLQHYTPVGRLELDEDLMQEWQQDCNGADSEAQMNGFIDVTRLQMERNVERSELDVDASGMITRICERNRPETGAPEPEA